MRGLAWLSKRGPLFPLEPDFRPEMRICWCPLQVSVENEFPGQKCPLHLKMATWMLRNLETVKPCAQSGEAISREGG